MRVIPRYFRFQAGNVGQFHVRIIFIGVATVEELAQEYLDEPGHDHSLVWDWWKNMRLYVGNLSWGTSEQSLREAFEAHGAVVSVNIITDRETGRSRGFGFVEMEEKAAGEAAVQQLDGAMLDGRNLKVNEARPRTDRGGGGGRGRGGGRRDFGGGDRRDYGGGGRRDFGGGDRRDRGGYQGRRDNDRNRDW